MKENEKNDNINENNNNPKKRGMIMIDYSKFQNNFANKMKEKFQNNEKNTKINDNKNNNNITETGQKNFEQFLNVSGILNDYDSLASIEGNDPQLNTKDLNLNFNSQTTKNNPKIAYTKLEDLCLKDLDGLNLNQEKNLNLLKTLNIQNKKKIFKIY